jgi:hypothetical protein
MSVSTQELRRFLIDVFNSDEFKDFCFDHFRDFYKEEFADGQTEATRVRLLVDYCDRREKMVELQAALHRERPEQLAKRFPNGIVPPPEEEQNFAPTASLSSIPVNQSGGIDMKGGNTNVGGDVTGRDKTVGGDEIIVNAASGSTIVFGENSKQSPIPDDELSRLLSQAQDLLQQRRFDEAVKLLRQSRKTYPDHSSIEDLYLEALYEQGIHVYLKHDLPKAKLIFQEVILIDSAYRAAAQYLGEIEQKLAHVTPPHLPFDYKWVVGTLVAVVACMAALLVVPEVRQFLGLDKPTPAPTSPALTPVPTLASTPAPTAIQTCGASAWVFNLKRSGASVETRCNGDNITIAPGEYLILDLSNAAGIPLSAVSCKWHSGSGYIGNPDQCSAVRYQSPPGSGNSDIVTVNIRNGAAETETVSLAITVP